jgi:hypothetical protein
MEHERLGMPHRKWQEYFTGEEKSPAPSPIMHNSENPHPGFAAVQHKIEGEGYSPEEAGAILASKTRDASKAAHKANPRLNRVKG